MLLLGHVFLWNTHLHLPTPRGSFCHLSSRCRWVPGGLALCADPGCPVGRLQPSRPLHSDPSVPWGPAGTAPGGNGPFPLRIAPARTAGRETAPRSPNSAARAPGKAFWDWVTKQTDSKIQRPPLGRSGRKWLCSREQLVTAALGSRGENHTCGPVKHVFMLLQDLQLTDMSEIALWKPTLGPLPVGQQRATRPEAERQAVGKSCVDSASHQLSERLLYSEETSIMMCSLQL